MSQSGSLLRPFRALVLSVAVAIGAATNVSADIHRKDFFLPASSAQCDPFVCRAIDSTQQGPVISGGGSRLVVAWLSDPVEAFDAAVNIYVRVIDLSYPP